MKSRHLPVAVLFTVACAGCARDDARTVRASGQIEATEVRVATKVPGTVAIRAVDEGDRVARGQVLAVLDTVDLDLQRRQAEAESDVARANLSLLLAGSRIEDVRAARAEVALRQADFDGAASDLARAQSLFESQTGSEKARDDARIRRDMARAALDAAREQLARLEHGSRPEERAAARASLARATARVEALAQNVRDCTIRSPVTGVVTERLTEAGELLTAGSGVVVVSDLDRPWLTAFVTGTELPRVRIGSRAEVTTDARGDRPHEGRVTYISPTAEFTPRNVQTEDERAKLVYRIKILLENKDGTFKPGMPATARILTDSGPAQATAQ
jgi:HlyD family secretion protein